MRRAVDRVEQQSGGLFPALGWNARDAFGLAVIACAMVAILVNVLFMQAGPHPAPMFKAKAAAEKPAAEKPAAEKPAPATTIAAAPGANATSHPRAVERAPLPPATPSVQAAPAAKAVPAAPKAAAPAAARTPGEIITDIQRELSRRGFFDGTVDGLYGPKTDSAIRDFEQLAGIRPSHEPNEALLQSIMRAPAKVTKSAVQPVARPAAPVRNETERAPSKRVIALQRVLAEFGYGQIKPSGYVDAETQAAIEKFERERKLPVTGQPSDRVARELAAVTGRPLE